ncbi:hypothetical protein J2Y69_002001 [Microbacterium resistens]|uniref:Uncharacterized protein n=1 Tax=Microbacterium resistens TaxID=156977 RepID=A0ABU1SEN1_9MICO|nr:hypothetical protein [Microbacterium resistens]MDR6867398.1 hypothetical protein [Microbacterium resistens]
MKLLRGILIAIVVVGVPSAFVLLLSRSNPDIIGFLPDDWEVFIIENDWIGFLVLGIEVAAALGATGLGSLIKKRENAA